jgi:hypothetical protein
MAIEQQVHLQCRFWMHSDEKTVRSRLEAMEGFQRWTMLRGPVGAMDGMVALLEDRVLAGFWRDAGGAMFRDGEGEPGAVGPGELYAMQLDMPVVLEQHSALLRDRILKQLEAISAYDYAVTLIRAAAADRREVLDLGGKGLDELPAEIGTLTELLALDLTRNRLTTLPAEIGRLAKLEELILSENRLVELPAEIGQLANLQILWLDGNKLETLPAEIGGLSELRHLQIQENALVKLPPEIGKLKNLRRLWLQHNALTSLPKELSELKNLRDWEPDGKHLPPRFIKALDVYGNPLTDPPPNVVAHGSKAIFSYLSAPEPFYVVRVVENSDQRNMDPNERGRELGQFKDFASAEAACKKVIDDYLAGLDYDTADELFECYRQFGYEPRMESNFAFAFNPYVYAHRRCKEIAAVRARM